MKRLFASFVVALTAFGSPVFAATGGPFDNGFNSNSLNNNSLYQATLSFSNGSGFCYFSPTAAIVSPDPTVPATNPRGTIMNRMVMYYKGVTYIGSALGTGDQEARIVTCDLNGGTEASSITSTTSNNSNFFGSSSTGSSNSSALTATVLSSSRSFTVNGNFTADVYQTAPTFRFKGTGQLAFLSPSSAGSVAGLAFTGISGLISSIVTAVGNANVGQNFDATVFTQAQAAVISLLNALPPLLVGASIDATFQGADIVTMTVEGTRRYL